jgi:hypothetical protein
LNIFFTMKVIPIIRLVIIAIAVIIFHSLNVAFKRFYAWLRWFNI